MSTSKNELTQIVREGFERACIEFTARIASLGFKRTRKDFWTRRHPLSLDFIHFHRGGVSYGAPRSPSMYIRVHFGIRVLNSSFENIALNGPSSDHGDIRDKRYHLRFNARSGSTYERCMEDLVCLFVEHGEPWFQKFRSADSLLGDPYSPLNDPDKEALKEALAGCTIPLHEKASLMMLGIKK